MSVYGVHLNCFFLAMKTIISFLVLALVLSVSGVQAQSWQWGISNKQPFSGVIEAAPISTDRLGNVFSGGNIFGDDTVEIGSFTISDTVGLQGAVIVKADPMGTVLWVFHISSSFNELKAIAADQPGNLYVSGIYLDSFCTIGSFTLANDSPDHAMSFLAKLSMSGNVLWAKNVAHSGGFLRGGLGVDDAGYIYVASEFSGHTATIGSTTLINSADTTSDIYIAKYNSAGSVIWATSFGAERKELCNGMSVAGDGSLYIIGTTTSDTLTIGSDMLIDSMYYAGGTSPYNYPFYAKFDSSGHPVWAKTMYTHTILNGITTDNKENIYLCGVIDSSKIFGKDTLTLVGSRNAFIARYDSTGALTWANSATATAFTTAYSVAADNCGNVWVGGYTDGALNCSGNTISVPPATADLFFLVAYDHCGRYIPGTGSMLGSGGDDFLGIIYDGQDHVYLSADYEILPLTVGADTLPVPGVAQENLLLAKFACGTMPCDAAVCCYAAPIASFVDSSNGSLFIYTGTTAYDSLKWDFGDGTYALTDTVIHSLPSGSHYVCVVVYSQCGTDTFCSNVNVAVTTGQNLLSLPATGIAVYPNPAATEYTIQTINAFPQGAKAELYDITGRLMGSYPLTGNKVVVSVSAMSPGTYECRIIAGNTVTVKRIVVARLCY